MPPKAFATVLYPPEFPKEKEYRSDYCDRPVKTEILPFLIEKYFSDYTTIVSFGDGQYEAKGILDLMLERRDSEESGETSSALASLRDNLSVRVMKFLEVDPEKIGRAEERREIYDPTRAFEDLRLQLKIAKEWFLRTEFYTGYHVCHTSFDMISDLAAFRKQSWLGAGVSWFGKKVKSVSAVVAGQCLTTMGGSRQCSLGIRTKRPFTQSISEEEEDTQVGCPAQETMIGTSSLRPAQHQIAELESKQKS